MGPSSGSGLPGHGRAPALARFLQDLDRYTGRVPLTDLIERLQRLEVTLADVRDFVRFHPERYQRNLMHAGPAYNVLILCWRNGQRSPIHNHRGSSCGVRVLQGEATETAFEHSPHGLVYATGSRRMGPGQVCGSQDDDTHQVSNLQAGDADLVTMHVYSPPLMRMQMFSLTDAVVRDFDDPVIAYCDGAGI